LGSWLARFVTLVGPVSLTRVYTLCRKFPAHEGFHHSSDEAPGGPGFFVIVTEDRGLGVADGS